MASLWHFLKTRFGSSTIDIENWGFELMKLTEKAVKAVVGDSPINLVSFRMSTAHVEREPRLRGLKIWFTYTIDHGATGHAQMVVWVTFRPRPEGALIDCDGKVFLCISGLRYLRLDLKEDPPSIRQDRTKPEEDEEWQHLKSVFV